MDLQFNAAIDMVKVKVKELDGHIIRSCEMRFSCEFDDAIAAALSKDARVALSALKNYGMEQVVLPLDDVDAQGQLVAGEGVTVEIPQMIGVKAKCTAGDPDDAGPPLIEFTFSALWSEAVWVFLGEYCGAFVQITLQSRQTSLPLPKPVQAKAS